MKLAHILALSFLCSTLAYGNPAAPAGGRLTATPVSATNEQSVIPVHIPGFELRVLDLKKTVGFQLDAERKVEVEIPVYIYFPTAGIDIKQLSSQVREMENALEQMLAVQGKLQDPELGKAILLMSSAIRDYASPNAPKKVAIEADETTGTGGQSRVIYEKVVSPIESPSSTVDVTLTGRASSIPVLPPDAQPETNEPATGAREGRMVPIDMTPEERAAAEHTARIINQQSK